MKPNPTHQDRRREHLEALHFENPFCPFCLVKTEWESREGELKSGKHRDNEAVLFPLVPRHHPWRSEIKGRNILICWRCHKELERRRMMFLGEAQKTWREEWEEESPDELEPKKPQMPQHKGYLPELPDPEELARAIREKWPNPRSSLRNLIFKHRLECCWCQRLCNPFLDCNHDAFPTPEHVIPRSEGGRSIPANLKLACRKCNNTRHHQPAPAAK